MKYDDNMFRLKDDRIIKWKLSEDKDKIGQLDVNKASTYFAGRKWYAWYAPDIPINDGPYKFQGLPGLIVKIEDNSKTHKYELIEIKKTGVFFL